MTETRSAREPVDAAEVEEGDGAVVVEEVVPRVGVGVEQSVSVQAGEHETEDGLAPTRAQGISGRGQFRPAPGVDVVGGQDPAGGQFSG